MLEHSSVGTLQRKTNDRGATITSLELVLSKVTERDISLLTWLRRQVINFTKGSTLLRQKGGPVG